MTTTPTPSVDEPVDSSVDIDALAPRRRFDFAKYGTADWWQQHWASVVAFGIVSACCLFAFAQQRPDLIFKNTTPAGGDVGAHVWWPAFVKNNLLPWRVEGWSMDWWAGFPVGQFYFPLPAVLVAILDLLLPYNIALKLVLAAGPALLPLGAYVCLRSLRAPRPTPEFASVAALFMVFFAGDPRTNDVSRAILGNQRISGGTLASALAGEFAFAYGLVFGLCFIGAFAAALDRRRNLALPAVLFACTVMSHAVVGVWVAVAALVVFAWKAGASLFSHGGLPRRFVTAAGGIVIVGGLLSAFWALPFVLMTDETTNLNYGKITGKFLIIEGSPFRLAFGYLADYWMLPPYLQWGKLLAIVAVIAALFRRRGATGLIAVMTVLSGALFVLWPQGHIWNLRFLPFWYLGLFLLAGIGAAEIWRFVGWFIAAWAPSPTDGEFAGDPARASLGPAPWFASRLPAIVPMCGAVLCTAIVLVGINNNLHAVNPDGGAKNYLPFWADYNMSGYENRAQKDYDEYRALINTLKTLPEPGRVVYEKAREGGGEVQTNYGTDFSLYLLPYWTDGKFPTIEGLYFEASSTTPFYFLMSQHISRDPSGIVSGLPYASPMANFDLGVDQMRKMGVKWFMAATPEVKALATSASGLKFTTSVPDVPGPYGLRPPNGWDIYEVLGSREVAPLTYEPVVARTRSERASTCYGTPKPLPPTPDQMQDPWVCAVAPWWENQSELDRPITDTGPSNWKRSDPRNVSSLPKQPLPPVDVTNVKVSQESVKFRVSRTGVPVMVNVTYFPNWRVEGAKGPYRASPNFMIVIPTSNEVTLTFHRSGAEWLGGFMSLVGLAGLFLLFRWKWPYDPRAPEDPGDGLDALLAPVPTAGGLEPEVVPAPPPTPPEPLTFTMDAPGPAPAPVPPAAPPAPAAPDAPVPPGAPDSGPPSDAAPGPDYIPPSPETGH